MSTDSPIKYNPDRVLTEAQKEINDDHHYWDWFDAWWEQDFSWEGLAKVQWNDSPDTSIDLQEYWSEYVEKKDLVPFGRNDDGTPRKWTIFHLPPHDRDGNKSPKHEMYQGDDAWKTGISRIMHLTGPTVEFDRVITNILKTSGPVVAHANQDERAHLEGVFFPRFYSNKNTIGRPIYIICDWCCLSSRVLFEYEPHRGFPHRSICPTIGANSRIKNACFFEAEFNEFNIGELTSFKDSIFLSHSSFSDTTFGEDVSFESCIFTFPVWFRCSSSDKQLYKEAPTNFNNARFYSSAWFSNRTFDEITNFSGTFFYKLADFHGCTFHQDTSFENTCFEPARVPPDWLIRFWTWVYGKPIDMAELSSNADECQRSFRTLRQLMERNGAWAEAFKFGRLELISKERRVPPFRLSWPFGEKREIDVPWWERLGSRLYGLIADYGQSALRPFLWLIGFYIIASVIYYALAGEWANPGAAMATAFQYSLPPVSTFAAQFFAGEIDQNFVDALLDHPFLTRLVMVTHGVTSLALVFFLLLALKRRFQIR